MYLSLLSLEHKHVFLDLEIYMSQIDGTFSEEEKAIINVHCMEMHIDNNDFQCELPLEEVLEIIDKDYSSKEKRIAFIELLATVMADNVYHDKEKELVGKLAELFAIDTKEVEVAFSIISDLKIVYSKFSSFIQEK